MAGPAAPSRAAVGAAGPTGPTVTSYAPVRRSLPKVPLAAAATSTTSADDLDSVRQAIGLVRKGRPADATAVANTIADPVARKLVEWIILRSDDNMVDFARYNAFITANPGWPSIVTLRRRAEAMLWQERAPPATVRAFFAAVPPMTAKGRFALARALLAVDDRAGAQAYVREAWRSDSFSRELENQALELFGDLLTRADDKARMDKRLYADDAEAAVRAAQRLGGVEPAIAKARAAVNEKSNKAKALLDALPQSARNDAGVIFSYAQWLRRNDKITEAGRLIMTAPRDPARLQDLDEWWVERRLTARKLLDIGDPRSAYHVVRDAVPPVKENYRAEHEFTAGWIALRFLHDPATAAHHFARIAQGTTNPIALARAGYWQGRAAEAANRHQEARAHYQAAARYNTAYYGQLARARLGLGEIALSPAPAPHPDRRALVSRLEVVRAAEILYAIGERDHLVPIMADLADKTTDVDALAALADLAARNRDARSVLLVGKTALGRGYAFDHFAFPTMGLPRYTPIGPEVEPAIVYSIARQESAFNPKIVSSANALGLMQVTPAAGRYIAKKFNVTYDQKRLLHDEVYNVQMGAAELGDVIARYRGSYILAFAAYNAGPGRVKEWIERYGDPRDPGIDAVDWVERIPFSETRNYVQRVMENVQVYRARFGHGSRLLIEADLRRGTAEN
jgi:soluble lytic murein transglycosylase